MSDNLKLLNLCKLRAAKHCTAKYTKKIIIAAVEYSSGEILAGQNIEMFTPLGCCAEYSVLMYGLGAVSGYPIKIMIYQDALWTISPCGNCKTLIESLAPKAEIIFTCQLNH